MIQLKITGMTCDSCAMHVKDALERERARGERVLSEGTGRGGK